MDWSAELFLAGVRQEELERYRTRRTSWRTEEPVRRSERIDGLPSPGQRAALLQR